MYFTDSVVHRIFVYFNRFYSLLFGLHITVAVCLQCSKQRSYKNCRWLTDMPHSIETMILNKTANIDLEHMPSNM